MFIILLVIAAVFLALATLGFGGRFNLLAAGMFVWLLTVILRTAGLV
jgi:hypothetical protein